jgi:hypothetical protein
MGNDAHDVHAVNIVTLSPDLLRLIFSFLPSLSLYFLREMCKEFKNNVNFVKLCVPRMDKQLYNIYNNTLLENRVGLLADFNGLFRHTNYGLGTEVTGIHPVFFGRNRSCKSRLFNNWITFTDCVNQNCCSNQPALGMTCFYYPLALPEYDSSNSHAGLNSYEYHRVVACQQGPIVKRKIPYCRMCMVTYVNFGERDDGKAVPYGPPIGIGGNCEYKPIIF